jgi:hypothetical protein
MPCSSGSATKIRGRLELARARSISHRVAPPDIYPAVGFERLLVETRPEVVIVAKPDGTLSD